MRVKCLALSRLLLPGYVDYVVQQNGQSFWRGRPLHWSRRYFYFTSRSMHYHHSKNSEEQSDSKRTTHFGFQTISEDEKNEKVAEVFHNVATKYDIMNDVMSVGIHRLWKDIYVQRLNPQLGSKLVDVGGGTGDIVFRVLKYLDIHNKKSESEQSDINNLEKDSSNTAITVDINRSMLEVGQSRAKLLGYHNEITWTEGDAENLPVPDSSVDVVTAAFAIRNVTNVRKAISEAYRILSPGGRLSVLEFSHVTNPIVKGLYDRYSFEMIPVFGEIITEDWNSYQYLVESIRKFPNQEEFADIFKEAGFKMVNWQNLTFGIVAIHSGFKI